MRSTDLDEVHWVQRGPRVLSNQVVDLADSVDPLDLVDLFGPRRPVEPRVDPVDLLDL
jgi:hypothetical protein